MDVQTQYVDIPNIYCQPGKISQVMMNLLDNAIDAVEKGGEILISAAEEKEFIVIKVQDNGSGIAPENLKMIFDPFYTTKEIGEGTGLGLSISYGIIKDHKGEILVEEVEPRGTSFVIKLPIE